MDSPLLFDKIPIFRDHDLTPDAKMRYVACISIFLILIQDCLKYLAPPAGFHLFLPASLAIAGTNCPGDKPAKFSGMILPGRTFLFLICGAFFYHPAVPCPSFILFYTRDQKINLSFHGNRDSTPSLLITVDCLYGCSEQLSNLFLCFVQSLPEMFKYLFVHYELPPQFQSLLSGRYHD